MDQDSSKQTKQDSDAKNKCRICGETHDCSPFDAWDFAFGFFGGFVVFLNLCVAFVVLGFVGVPLAGMIEFFSRVSGPVFFGWITLIFTPMLFLDVNNVRVCALGKTVSFVGGDLISDNVSESIKKGIFHCISVYIAFKNTIVFRILSLESALVFIIIWGSLFFSHYIWAALTGLVIFACEGFRLFEHNRGTFPSNIQGMPILRAIRRTLAIGVALFVLLLPALAVKGGIDLFVFRKIDSLDAKLAGVKTLSVPSVKTEDYPWHSPLRWFGVRKTIVTQTQVSAEGAFAAPRWVLFCTKWMLQAISGLTSLVIIALFARSMASIFSRQLIARGVGLSYYVPPSDPSAALRRSEHHRLPDIISDRLELESPNGGFVYLRWDFSPSGGTPWVEIPQSGKSFLARWQAGNYIMHKFALSADPVTVLASEGHRFARIELADEDEVVFSYRSLIGWSDSVRLSSSLSLQLGGIALGRWLVHRATGPGSLLFDVCGQAEIRVKGSTAPFEVQRILAFDSKVVFDPAAKPGWLDTLMGVVAISPRGGGRCLLDSRGDRKPRTRSIFAFLIRAYSFR